MRVAVVEVEEEEDERYALDGVCRVLAGMPMPIGTTLLLDGVASEYFGETEMSITFLLRVLERDDTPTDFLALANIGVGHARACILASRTAL
ncbi:hypothetical protein ZWY2020_029726 [Hordeum vulgare]|nr:hypothetical protein ZWY2020_029726 [Hordeum vulgare]